MRLRNDPNAINKLKETNFLIEKFPHKIDKNTVIEFGMGKGEMITKMAKKNPNINYIGIEKFATITLKAVRKAEKLEINNFKVICEDIKMVSEIIEGKTNTIWLTFSDPWPKARHFKRRLTYKYFLEKYKNILSKEGILKFKTDNDKLFEWSIESLKDFGAKIIFMTNDLHKSRIKDNIMTGYEQKWIEKGKKINYLEAQF